MKINYKIIKKIHLYACLSTVALLLMFIFTSYMMIHHDWFNHESTQETEAIDLATAPATETDWQHWAGKHDIPGRLVRSNTNKDGEPVREYATAAGSTRVIYRADRGQVEITRTSKSTANAIIGVHRHRGYGGGLTYNFYAFLLDLLAVGLIIFTITGIIMWFRLLKNDRWAWVIFIAGGIYFGITLLYLTYG